jgi:hypothetical protein
MKIILHVIADFQKCRRPIDRDSWPEYLAATKVKLRLFKNHYHCARGEVIQRGSGFATRAMITSAQRAVSILWQNRGISLSV